jgi:riboflavin synthase
MFTGIIESIGTVMEAGKNRLKIAVGLDGIKQGDSISVNGVCLTVTQVRPASQDCFPRISRSARPATCLTGSQGRAGKGVVFDADVSEETISVTNIGALRRNGRVNIERAMAANGRLGGHVVTGHVEAAAKIVSVSKSREGRVFTFEVGAPAAARLSGSIVNKGSVALDGVSLTVIAPICRRGSRPSLRFSSALVPFTLKNTTFGFLKKGDAVNLETDILAKYASWGQVLSAAADDSSAKYVRPAAPADGDALTEKLKEAGFIS